MTQDEWLDGELSEGWGHLWEGAPNGEFKEPEVKKEQRIKGGPWQEDEVRKKSETEKRKLSHGLLH